MRAHVGVVDAARPAGAVCPRLHRADDVELRLVDVDALERLALPDHGRARWRRGMRRPLLLRRGERGSVGVAVGTTVAKMG